jgi:sugar lactone lactonase YvrE
MRGFRLVLAIAAGAALIAFLLVPSPIDPVAWKPPARPELRGPLAPNFLLRRAVLLGQGILDGPEDVAIGPDGLAYASVADGRIMRFHREPVRGGFEAFAATGGRPLGLDFDDDGTLWVADSVLGLLSVATDGKVTVRESEADGVVVQFADDVDVAPNGKVYFSDASTRYRKEDLMLEVLEGRPHGRLLEYDPQSNDTNVLLEELYFANGVAVSPDSRFVLVAETFRYRIQRYWLTGPRAGKSEVFADNLPGFPDGISSTDDGLFWLALHSPRSGLLDRVLHRTGWIKGLVGKLPGFLFSAGSAYGLVVALEQDGRYLQSFHDPGGAHFSYVTSAEEHEGHLYLGTVEGNAVARLPVRDSATASSSR